ncbi:MAG: metal-dependent hydrolase [Acidobacteriota bacterium]|jgi:inner membrane protein
MPLPVAHSLAGVAVYKGLDADGTLFTWPRLLLAVFIANAPDLDMIPGILMGEPNRYHHVGFSHSGLFALAVALAAGLFARATGKYWPVAGRRLSAAAGTALMVALLMLSHLLLDALTGDSRPPIGIPMWWPVSDAPLHLYDWFPHVAKLGGTGGPLRFVGSLLNSHNLYAATWEFLTLAPLIALIAWWRKRHERPEARHDEQAARI